MLWRSVPVPVPTGEPSLFIFTQDPALGRFPLSTLEFANRIAEDDANLHPPYNEQWDYAYSSIQVGDYAYYISEVWIDQITSATSSVAVHKYHLPTLSHVATLIIPTTEEGGECYGYGLAVDPAEEHIFTHCWTFDSLSVDGYASHKIRLSDFTCIDQLSTADYQLAGWGSLADSNNLVSDGTYIYADVIKTSGVNPYGKILRIQQSDMSVVDVIDLSAEIDTNAQRAQSMVILDDYIYFSTYGTVYLSPPRLVKVSRSSFTIVDTQSIDDSDPYGFDGGEIFNSVITDGTYLYCLTDSSNLMLVKIDPSDLSIVASARIGDATTRYPHLGPIIDGKLYMVTGYPSYDTPFVFLGQEIFEIDLADLSVIRSAVSAVGNASMYAFRNIHYAAYTG